MADTEFEEFRKTFEKLPTYRQITAPFYSLNPGIDDIDDSPSPQSDLSDPEDNNVNELMQSDNNSNCHITRNVTNKDKQQDVVEEDDEIGDGLKTGSCTSGSTTSVAENHHYHHNHNQNQHNQTIINQLASHQISPFERTISGQFGERRRRKLPEIPKNKKSSIMLLCGQQGSLAEELGTARTHIPYSLSQGSQKTFLSLKCGYLLDEDSSPDSERLQSLGDVDSGHSTAHSPIDFKSMSPQLASPISQSPFPPPFGGVPFSQLEMLEATHRGLHKFIPRHQDEIEIEIGDPIYVQKEADDFWCEGVNLRTGRQGIFPSAYAVDLDYNDFDPCSVQVKKERYLLGYLGSVETLAHKGTGVVCQAVRKIVSELGDSPTGQSCILEVSDQGLRMVDRSRPQGKKEKKPCIDYFYSLKNVSFCAFHPRDHRYIGFITKHPTVQRFACHVFKGNESTRPVAEAVGRAFQRFYQKFIETAYPIEDIYIE